MSPLPGAPPPNCLPRPCSPEDFVTPMTVVPDVGGELGLSVSHMLSPLILNSGHPGEFTFLKKCFASFVISIYSQALL